MAASLRQRKNSEEHDVTILKSGEKAIASAIAESDDTSDDLLIREAAPIAFKVAYPRHEPWQGADLIMLLERMRDIVHKTAAMQPVHVYDIDEAQQFCTEMFSYLSLKSNGH